MFIYFCILLISGFTRKYSPAITPSTKMQTLLIIGYRCLNFSEDCNGYNAFLLDFVGCTSAFMLLQYKVCGKEKEKENLYFDLLHFQLNLNLETGIKNLRDPQFLPR